MKKLLTIIAVAAMSISAVAQDSTIVSVPVYSYAGVPATGTSEIDTLTLTATSSFTIGIAGSHATSVITTGTGTAAVLLAIDNALEAHPSIGTAGVTTAEGALTTGTGTVTITMIGKNAKMNFPLLSIVTGTATASIATTTGGVAATFRDAPTGTLLVNTTTPSLYQNTSTTVSNPTWVAPSLLSGAISAATLTGANSVTGTLAIGSAGTALGTLVTGTAVLTSGSVTISNTAVTALSRFSFAPVGPTPNAAIGLGAIVADTSFIILSGSTTDARIIHYQFTK